MWHFLVSYFRVREMKNYVVFTKVVMARKIMNYGYFAIIIANIYKVTLRFNLLFAYS